MYVLNSLSLAYHELRRSEEALGCCQQALAISRELGVACTTAWPISPAS
jgi:hypothetical protein